MKTKEILIIYDYERIVPPFMQTLIKHGINVFDSIKYITPPLTDNYRDAIKSPKIDIITWSKMQRCLQYVKGIISPFRLSFWKELVKGKISKASIANTGKFFFCSDGFIQLSEKIIKDELNKGNKVYLLATWMSVDAFTCARLKHKYPGIKAFALAHSGEVMIERNPFIYQSFHVYIYENLNKVFFISRTVLENYLKTTHDIGINERFANKIGVRYLGSPNNSHLTNPNGDNKEIILLSCSRIDANKRLDRIISSLKKWSGVKLHWIHIGTGVLENEIKKSAYELEAMNPYVSVHFTGQLENEDVIRYYSEIHVDLFINVSRSEGLPISIMEAMSYGIPCVATNVGGTSEIVNSTTGFLIEQNFSDEDLLSRINSFRSLPDAEQNKMRASAREMWARNFDAEKNAKALYNEIRSF